MASNDDVVVVGGGVGVSKMMMLWLAVGCGLWAGSWEEEDGLKSYLFQSFNLSSRTETYVPCMSPLCFSRC